MNFSLTGNDDTPDDSEEIKRILFDNYDPENTKDLELNEDNTFIVNLDARLESLGYVLESIKAASGISQNLALEAHKAMGSFLNEDLSIGMFTKLPSASQYRASLESITGSIMALIIAGIVAIIAMAYKMYKWIFGVSESADTKGVPSSKLSKALDTPAEVKEAIETIEESQPEIVKETNNIITEINRAIQEDKEGTLKNMGKTHYSLKDLECLVMNYQATKDPKNPRPPHLDAGDSAMHDLIYNHDSVTWDVLNRGQLMQLLLKAETVVSVWPALLMNTIDAVDKNLSLVAASFKQIGITEEMRPDALKALVELDSFARSVKSGSETGMLKGISYSLSFNNQKINPNIVATMLEDMYNANANSTTKYSFRGFTDALDHLSKAQHTRFFSAVERMYDVQNGKRFVQVLKRLEELRGSMNEKDASMFINNDHILSDRDLKEKNAKLANKLKEMNYQGELPASKGQQAVGNRMLFNLYRDIITTIHNSILAYNRAFAVYNKVYTKISLINSEVLESIKDIKHVMKENDFSNATDELKELMTRLDYLYRKYKDSVKKL